MSYSVPVVLGTRTTMNSQAAGQKYPLGFGIIRNYTKRHASLTERLRWLPEQRQSLEMGNGSHMALRYFCALISAVCPTFGDSRDSQLALNPTLSCIISAGN